MKQPLSTNAIRAPLKRACYYCREAGFVEVPANWVDSETHEYLCDRHVLESENPERLYDSLYCDN